MANPQYFIDLLALVKRGRCTKSLLSKCTRKKYKDYSYLKEWIDTIIPDIINNNEYNYNTKVYWIIFGLTDFPKCQNANCNCAIKRNVFLITNPRYMFCNNKCQITSQQFKTARHDTWIKNLGVDYPTQSKDVIKTRQSNNLKKYGVLEPTQLDSVKQIINTNRRTKYNGEWEGVSSKNKRENTNIKLYGHKCSLYGINQKILTRLAWKKYKNGQPLADSQIRELGHQQILQRYGCDYFAQSDEYKKLWLNEIWKETSLSHQFETKMKNNSFHISKQEQAAYELLVIKYGYDDIIRQFKSNEYPFACDFYIKSLNLYIECNFTWTHGEHWFDQYNKADIEKLNLWQSKQSAYYNNAIKTWTIKDPLKHKYAINNKLNYEVYWSLNEFKSIYQY